MSGNFDNEASLTFKWYNQENGKFIVNDATRCLEDSKHRLWVISNSGGLFRYDAEKDCFTSVNEEYHWDIDRIYSIVEDKSGTLWLTTDNALISLNFNDKMSLTIPSILMKTDWERFALFPTPAISMEMNCI